jgi:predicted DNA-binding protein (UPF0251 family)
VPRPQKERRIAAPPAYSDFKPTRVPTRLLESVDLTLDEYEAVRLCDYRGLDHATAAGEIGVSRPTFTRLIDKARAKLAQFLVEGLHLSIEGGSVHFRANLYLCGSCRKVFPVKLANELSRCPFCESEDLENLAEQHGHGECCRE